MTRQVFGFQYNEEHDEFYNHDHSYSLTITPNPNATFTAYFWTFTPGFFDPRDGGRGPEWNDFEIGTFKTFREAEEAALRKVAELEERDEEIERQMTEALPDQSDESW